MASKRLIFGVAAGGLLGAGLWSGTLPGNCQGDDDCHKVKAARAFFVMATIAAFIGALLLLYIVFRPHPKVMHYAAIAMALVSFLFGLIGWAIGMSVFVRDGRTMGAASALGLIGWIFSLIALYLNTFDIFHSFDQLNNHFNKLIQNIPLYLNFENVRKKTFDRFCTTILLNPEIKQHIYSLNLSNKDACGQIELFLTFFSLNEFSNLRSLSLIDLQEDDGILLKSMLPLIPQLRYCHLVIFDDKINDVTSALPMSQLRTLSVSKLEFDLMSTNQISSITKLTVNYYYCNQLNYLFKYMPMLKYLHIVKLNLNKPMNNISYITNDNCAVYLKELIIDDFQHQFLYFQMLVKQTPNLKSLIISASIHKSMIDANAWENLIKSSLPYLNNFMFKFEIYHGGQEHNDIINMFKQFQSDFWQIQHHWDTVYVLDINFALIFTTPYYSNTYELIWYTDSYSNKPVNYFNVHDKVTNLKLYDNLSINKYPYYFSNVTELNITNMGWPSNINDHLFNEGNIQHLKERVNLSKLKHLDLASYHIKTSILLQILKESPQLSEMTVDTDLIRSFFDNRELCEYLSKMIKTLHIIACHGYHDMEKFHEIFSSVEKLYCGFVRMSSQNAWDFWISLISHISKFSAISIWNISTAWIYEEKFFSQLQDEAIKRNLIFRFIPPDRDKSRHIQTKLQIWIDEKMD
ncbi:unnamed protein product [Rotaria sordida]|uniref:Uncharacterized protein n=1 Tax=Rotaria sordida TaxID=392033 RepID=A0A819SPL7_9BILA|nr:unnamed protein product [Rotaria sordida]